MAVQTGRRRYFDTVPRLMEGGGAFLEYNHSLWASHESPIWLGVYGEYARSAVNLLKGYELEQPARMVHGRKGNTGDVFSSEFAGRSGITRCCGERETASQISPGTEEGASYIFRTRPTRLKVARGLNPWTFV